MAKTISSTIAHGVSYSAVAANNPVTITTTGAIHSTNASAALLLAAGQEWTVVNNGQVSARIAYGINATLATITNTGLIAAGGKYGINLGGDATLQDSVVVNSGTIIDSETSGQPDFYAGIYLREAGEVTNQVGGLISGAANGILGSYATLNPNLIINQGTIRGGTFSGIAATGELTLNNSGVITGGSVGVQASNLYVGKNAGATNAGANIITNAAGGVIQGGTFGVTIAGANSTMTNAGTVSGASDSVIFTAGYSGDRLVDDPGAVFNGTVNGGNTLGSGTVTTLELASGATTGTLSGLGSAITNFAAVGVDSGANWVMSGTNTLGTGATLTDAGNLTLASALAGAGTLAFSGTGHTLTVDSGVGITPTIAGLNNNTLDLIGVHATSASFGGGHLTLTGTGAPVTLALAGTYSTTNFHVSYVNGATVFTACFAEGTAIETEMGPLPVERLCPGMGIRTASGALRPLRWLGHRHHTAAEIATRDELRPVRIEAGALGNDLPRRPLRLSPEHAILLDGVLVPAVQLLGVPGITQEAEPEAVTYFHVELDTHDTILAEGAAAETYIDLASDAVFDNAETRPTPPATIQCAPRITSGPVLAAIRERLGATPGQPAPGALRGNIESTLPGHIAGWAAAQHADAPIRLRVTADGIPLGTAIANGFRFDLHRAGMGSAAFTFNGPIPIGTRSIAITSEADGTHLPGSPFSLPG